MAVIAILDDSATNRHIYSRLAAAVDCVEDVKAFANPEQALAVLAEAPPDLIVTDYKMPEMDGAAFVRAFRQLPGCSDIPIIVVTVYEERDFRLRALEAGATDFLLSPVDHHEFMTRARNLLKLRLQQKIIEDRTYALERELKSVENSREAALRGSSERLAQVIDTVPAMISATDTEGRYVFVNAFHAAIFGKEPGDLIGNLAAEYLGAQSGEHQRVLDAMVFADGRGIDEFEQEIVDSNGNARWFLTSKAALHDSDGHTVHVLTSSLEITDRRRAALELMHVAYHDALTGLPNRALIRNTLKEIADKRAERSRALAVHLIDVDRFKGVNEALGFAIGDDFIQIVAQRLKTACGANDMLGHFGGDEFVVLQEDAVDEQGARQLAQRLLSCISQPLSAGGNEIMPTASLGVSLFPGDGDHADELIRNASLAMDRAKSEGGNTFRFFAAGMNRKAKAALTLGQDLRRALSNSEFELHYQPQIALNTGRIVGVEALLRWRRSSGELVPPDQFLPYAEESGLILPISQWVLHEACRDAASWTRVDLPPLRVAVNMSPTQFKRQDVCKLVQTELERTALSPERLELELTENLLMQNAEIVAKDIAALRDVGVQFAIDDFGTGYSSLSYIRTLPINRLKIDRSFIANVASSASDAAIVRTILALADALGIAVTAEGVETNAQLERLNELGCDEVQGYFFSRPLAARDCMSLLLAHFGRGSSARQMSRGNIDVVVDARAGR